MKFNLKILILISLIFLGCKPEVDLIVYNGNIYTVNEEFKVSNALVIKDGLFYEIGTNDIINKYNSKELIDLNGSTVLPGLIDAHCHFYGLGLNQQVIDLVGTQSFKEVLSRLESNSNINNSVIKGRGWDQNDWKVKKFPEKSELDKLYPDIPVVLERIDGHAYLVNQKALDLAKITNDTKSSNGTIIKKNGKITGLLIDGPMSLIDNILPELSIYEKEQACSFS